MKKKITLMISILLLGVIGATYAFFAVDITGEGEDIVINAGTLRLVYNDGNSVSLLKALPGESVTKTVSVTNTGTLEANYDMSWIDLINQIENKELVYTVTCTSYINYTNSNKAVNGTCEGKDETTMSITDENFLSSVTIFSGITHEYTITILFKNIEGPQNYNQGKIFSAKINVNETNNLNLKTNDLSILALYVDGEPVENLDLTKNYTLESYTCTNGETASWRNGDKAIIISPLSRKTNCTLNFNEYDLWYQGCNSLSNNLNCKVIANNNCTTNSTVTSCTPQTDDSIQFNQVSSNTNGLGLYYTEAEGETEDYDENEIVDRVYYYRGAVVNNNVRFGGYCWRIIRTNEDGSVRMIYNGTWDSTNNKCKSTNAVEAASSFYYSSSEDSTKNNEYVQSDGTSSLVKTAVETWYTTYIENSILNTNNALTSKIANVPYCADKTNETIGGYGGYKWYGAANRLLNIASSSDSLSSNYMLSTAQPIFKCNDSENKHTALGDTWHGNGKLAKPVGLITVDEVIYAGGVWYVANYQYYLRNNENYWTMSPSYSDNSSSGLYYVYYSGNILSQSATSNIAVYPVLSLKSDTIVSSGNGSYTQPYIVGPN